MIKTKKKVVKKTIKKAKKKAVKLTEEQAKRVAIMQDAIAQLKIEAFLATPGQYIGNRLTREVCNIEASDNKELKGFMGQLVNKKKPCTVCAKGAIFLSGIRKFNNFSLGEAKDNDLGDIASGKAQKLVGEENADRIERYFEGWTDDYWWEDEPDDNEIEEAYLVGKWKGKYPDATDRLIAILKNAIKHKGIFTPENEDLKQFLYYIEDHIL